MPLEDAPISLSLGNGPIVSSGVGFCLASYLDELGRAGSLDAIAAILGEASRALGFPYHALVHHADLARPPRRFLCIQNYPLAWVDTYASAGLHRVDPAQRLAGLRPGSFAWADIAHFLSLSGQEMRMMAEAHSAGLGEGFTVPLHAFGQRAASCSFVTEAGQVLPAGATSAAEAMARAAFSAIFDLTQRASLRSLPRLTPRQRECLKLLAQGKTDWEIGTIMGLTENTVTTYLKAARQVLGVSRRTQLAVAAVGYGLIGIGDIADWQSPL